MTIDGAKYEMNQSLEEYLEKAIVQYDAGQYDAALALALAALRLFETRPASKAPDCAQKLEEVEALAAKICTLKRMYADAAHHHRNILARNRYHLETLRALLILLIEEDEVEVIAFLNQLYNKNDVSELSFLIDAIGEVSKGKLLHYYIQAKKRILGEDSVDIDQLFALRRYEKLCVTLGGDLVERIKLQSALLVVSINAEESIEQAFLPEAYKRVIRRYHCRESASLENGDFQAYHNILLMLLKTTEGETIQRYARLAVDFDTEEVLLTADELMDGSYVEEALWLYLHCERSVQGDVLRRLNGRIGECYFKTGRYAEAERYLMDAQIDHERKRILLKWIHEKNKITERNTAS